MKRKVMIGFVLVLFLTFWQKGAVNVSAASNLPTIDDNIESVTGEGAEYQEIEKFDIYYKYGDKIINSYLADDGKYYLFLPSTVDVGKLTLNYSGSILSSTNDSVQIFNDGEEKKLTGDFSGEQSEFSILCEEGWDENIVIMQSELPSMFVQLEDGIQLEEVHANGKDVKYSSTVSIDENSYGFSESSAEFKGRGNSSWVMDKKGYQIKYNKKENVLGMGKAKKWILIPNHCDPSLLKNQFTFDFSRALGMEYTMDCQSIDLWVNGEYLGTYLLTEKVEIGEQRVHLSEEGVLVELDDCSYQSETYFQAKRSGYHFVLKDPDPEDEGAMENFGKFEKKLNDFETALYDGHSWQEVSSYIDVESFIQYYFVREFSSNNEAYIASFFLYMDGEDDVIHAGPIWDYDSAYGFDTSFGNTTTDTFDIPSVYPFEHLRYPIEIPEFASEVNNLWTNKYKEKVKPLIDGFYECEDKIYDSAAMNFVRWNILGGRNPKDSPTSQTIAPTYQENVDRVYQWISERYEYFDSRYAVVDSKPDIRLEGIYIPSTEGDTIHAGAVCDSKGINIKYRWWIFDYAQGGWIACTQWNRDNWLEYKFPKAGDYAVRVEVKTSNSSEIVAYSQVNYKYVGSMLCQKVIDGKKYMVYQDGTHYTGWYDMTNNWRLYFDPQRDGAASVGVTEVKDIKYLFNEDGLLCTGGGTPEVRGEKYWTNVDGSVNSGWLTLGVWKLYFDKDTYEAYRELSQIDNKRYLFDQNGVLQAAAGTPVIDGKKYWFAEDGSLQTGWLKLGDWKMYFYDETCEAAVGIAFISGRKCLFDKNGILIWEESINLFSMIGNDIYSVYK